LWGSLSLVASEEVAAATSRFTEAMREFKACRSTQASPRH
jgi:hypothetical protein